MSESNPWLETARKLQQELSQQSTETQKRMKQLSRKQYPPSQAQSPNEDDQ